MNGGELQQTTEWSQTLFANAPFPRRNLIFSGLLSFCFLRIRLFVVCIYLLQATISLNAQSSNLDTNSLLNSFKSFIATPPPIKDLAYSMNYYMDGNGFPTNQTLFYQAKWQSNAYFLRQASKPDDFDTFVIGQSGLDLLFINFEDTYCFLTALNSFRVWENQKVSRESKVHPYGFERMGKLILSKAMNFGIQEMPIGSLQWSGDSFKATNEVNVSIEGRISVISNGLPVELKYDATLPDSGIKINHLVLLSYSPRQGIPQFIPTSISTFIVMNGKPQPYFSIAISSLTTNSAAFDSSAYNYKTYVTNTSRDILTFSNEIVFIKSPNQPVKTMVVAPSPSQVKHKRGVILVGFFVITALFVLIVRAKSRKQN